MKLLPILKCCIEIARPYQWIKNLLVWAGLFFALFDMKQRVDVCNAIENTFFAFIAFCLISSTIYIINDIVDAENDKLHPEKKSRPIPSGRMTKSTAITEGVILLIASFIIAYFACGIHFAKVLLIYFIIQILYSLILKKVVFVDVVLIACGFLLRAYAGAVSAGVIASTWMIVCTFFAALFLGFCKRYSEFTLLGSLASKHRAVLKKYNEKMLKISILTSAVVSNACYLFYTVSPVTVEKLGTSLMILTVPFVIYGFVRYVHLVFKCGSGGRPEKVLTQDKPIIVDYFLFVLVCVLIMIFK